MSLQIISDSFLIGPESARHMRILARSSSGLTLDITFIKPRIGMDGGWLITADRWVPHKGWQSVLRRVPMSVTHDDSDKRFDKDRTNEEVIEQVFKIVTELVDGG